VSSIPGGRKSEIAQKPIVGPSRLIAGAVLAFWDHDSIQHAARNCVGRCRKSKWTGASFRKHSSPLQLGAPDSARPQAKRVLPVRGVPPRTGLPESSRQTIPILGDVRRYGAVRGNTENTGDATDAFRGVELRILPHIAAGNLRHQRNAPTPAPNRFHGSGKRRQLYKKSMRMYPC